MATLWWILANTIFPIFLPFLVLWPWRLAKGNVRYDEQLRRNTSCGAAVKNGQFCLTTIALCASSLHEVLATAGHLPGWMVATTLIEGVIGAASLLIYTLAMAFDTDIDLTKKHAAWFKHYKWGSASLGMCGLVGALEIANHIGLSLLG